MELNKQAGAENTSNTQPDPMVRDAGQLEVEREAGDLENLQIQLQHFRKAVNNDPRNTALLVELGKAAESVGDMERARWAYKRAIRLDPDLGQAYLQLGRMYQKDGRTKQAINAFQNFLKYSADDAQRKEVMTALKSMLGKNDGESSELIVETTSSQTLAKAWQELGLTPAEALFLADPENSSGRQMMRYTMLDLAIRGVLDLTENYQVGRGENFDATDLRPHEALFAKYFSRFDDYIDVDRLSRAALAELNSRYDLFKQQYVFRSLIDKGYIELESRRAWGVIPVKQYILTQEGIRARNKARRLLKQTDNQILRSLKTNPESAKAYVSQGGPPILLIEEFPEDYFQELQDRLEEMGFAPTMNQVTERTKSAASGSVLEELVKSILGEG